MRKECSAVIVLFGVSTATSSFAVDFDLGPAAGTFTNRYSFGAAWRVERQDERLIGKLNVPGQQNLCPDACISFSGDPEPNQRLIAAKGSFEGSNQDNGDLNYQPGDMVAGVSMLDSTLSLSWKDYTFKLRGVSYFDPGQSNFEEYHPDTHYQPQFTRRGGESRKLLGLGFDLSDAYLAGRVDWHDHPVRWSIGYQRIRWGESTAIAIGGLNEINPPDQRRFHQPGYTLDQVFQPVPLITLGTEVFEGVSVDALYQLAWRPVITDASGSYYSGNDLTQGGRYLMDSLGGFSEDPDGKLELPTIAGLVSDSSATSPVFQKRGYARDTGQYGVKLSWFAADFNSGTEFDFYYLNYHNRLPLIGAQESAASCSRLAKRPSNVYSVLIACQGFKVNPDGLEPLPIDTSQTFLQYPENVHLFGTSFNTNVGRWSLAGEYAFRPNMPLQVHLTDILFTSLQQSFPTEDVVLSPESLAHIGGLLEPGVLDPKTLAAALRILAYYVRNPAIYTLPSADRAIPSYIQKYRGVQYAPGQSIDGYERLQVGQMDLTAIRALSASELPIGADQTLLALEAGFTQVYNMPSRSQLQFDGGGPGRTHASPGADGTGSGGVGDPSRLNPTQQTSGFADSFAWGYRVILRSEYNDVFSGINLKPQLFWSHDVHGIAPLPSQNFIQGQMQWNLSLEAELSNRYSTTVFWQDSTGGGGNNLGRDRGELGFTFAYSF
jgi:hypothetical protein